jgi:hypothetical protein
MTDDDPNARRSDPETSKRAGSDIRAEKAADRAKVYTTYHGYHPTPLADYQMERILGGAQNGKWRKRRSDLTDDGVLVGVDTIVNPSTNKQVIRWGLRDASQPFQPKQKKPRTPPSASAPVSPLAELPLFSLMGVHKG